MNKDLAGKLRLIAAWHTPGGPTPAQPCPRKHEVCAEAADEIAALRKKADLWDAINILWNFQGKTLEEVMRMRAAELAAAHPD